MSLQELPSDIYFEIFASYNVQELCNCMLVCKRLKEVAQTNNLWKKFTENHHKLTSESSYTNYRNNTITFDFFHKISKPYFVNDPYYQPDYYFNESRPQIAFSNKLFKIKSNNLESIPDEIHILDNIRSVTISIANDYNPKGFSRLKNLKNLTSIEITRENRNKESYLQEQFDSVIDELSTIPFLTNLTIKNNNLKELPESFKKLSNLKFLDISYNCFESIPNVIYKMNILTINLADNKIKEIPKELAKMDSLYELNLANNKITVLENISNELAELDITCNPIETIQDDCLNSFDSMVKFKCNSLFVNTIEKQKLDTLKQKAQNNLKKIEKLTY